MSRAVKVLGLSVSDQRGGRWDERSVPRAPRFLLTLDAMPSHPESRVWLLAGTVNEDDAADLRDPPLRQATQARVVAVALEVGARQLVLVPVHGLEPGLHYTLAVLEDAESLWTQEIAVSDSPAAGAALVESWPADQARGVPPNLPSLLLRFDGYLDSELTATLRAGTHIIRSETHITSCTALGFVTGDCVQVRPMQALPKGAAISLNLAGARDATGAALDPIMLEFHTANETDERAPRLAALSCALDERELPSGGCALEQDHALFVRISVDEPVLATLTAAHQTRSALSVGSSVELALSDLRPGEYYPASLRLTDLSGHTSSEPLALSTARDLPTISIDEVRSDPLGPEPAQESIELLNFGSEITKIMGFFVSEDAAKPGVRIVEDLSVLPGERVLVVSADFDPRDTADGALSPGIRLAHTDKALSMSNEGESLYLRDANGRRLSSAPRMGPAHSGACIARISHDPRTGAPQSFAPDPNATCTPGRETSWP